MEHLFQSWESFVTDIKAAAHVLLLSDYDGTLTPIVSRPEEAILSPELRNRLLALARNPAFSVGIISGRSLSEIKAMVGVEGIYYAGNHGLEIEGPGLKYINLEAKKAQRLINDIANKLSTALSSIGGVIIEDKGLSLSVHYRLVKEDEVSKLTETFNQITSPQLGKGKIRVTAGKKVWEVRPPIEWHKGKAVEAITAELKKSLQCEQLLSIYLGDDSTDEDAFRVIHRPQSWSIFVGSGSTPSNADYFLDSTSEVSIFLSRLLQLK